MNYYFVHTLDLDRRIVAASVDEAVAAASDLVKKAYAPPLDGNTYWVYCELYDEDRLFVRRWNVAIEPLPPKCEAPVEELAEASVEDLERAWRTQAWREDGHLWARSGRVEGFCMRCGTVQYAEYGMTDPVTGETGLRTVFYRSAWGAEEIADRYHRALKSLRMKKGSLGDGEVSADRSEDRG